MLWTAPAEPEVSRTLPLTSSPSKSLASPSSTQTSSAVTSAEALPEASMAVRSRYEAIFSRPGLTSQSSPLTPSQVSPPG